MTELPRVPAPSRRAFLAGAAGLAALPVISFSAHAAVAERPLVIFILRGAMDGLAAAIPYEEPRLQALRASLTPPRETAHAIDEGFGLHPALEFVHAQYQAGNAAILHATASPYRERSHFDGQDLLEAGLGAGGRPVDGWLNRAIARTPGAPRAVGIGQTTPLILMGPAATATWSPNVLPPASEETLNRLALLYEGDALLSAALTEARALEEAATGGAMAEMTRGPARGIEAAIASGRAAGRLIAAEGAAAAVVGLNGWDTHQNQGAEAGLLARNFAGLDGALRALQDELGAAWNNTAVLVFTEFGRTVAMNGTGGSDHGTASAAFVLGGAVNGGRILGDWPGLNQLYQDRDLRPANALHGLLKGMLRDHWGLDASDLDQHVFPDSRETPSFSGLLV